MTVSFLAGFAGVLAFTFTMVYASLADITTMQLRNSLMLRFLLAFVVLAPLAGFRVSEFGWSVAVALAVLAGGLALFSFGWIGGGDAKFATVTALWLGADQTALYLLYTALFGGALTAGLMLLRLQPLPAWLPNGSWIVRLHSRRSGVPYGVAMALAGLVALPGTRWMTTAF